MTLHPGVSRPAIEWDLHELGDKPAAEAKPARRSDDERTEPASDRAAERLEEAA
jgi:hypothetical protein